MTKFLGILMVYNWYTNGIQMVYKYRFCGWVDIDLSTLGEHEAETAGQALVAAGLRFSSRVKTHHINGRWGRLMSHQLKFQ